MNKLLKPSNLPWIILGAGILGAALRALLFATGMDEKRLLISGHGAQLLIWLLTAAVAVLLLMLTWDLKQAAKYSFNFPAFLAGAIGAALACVGIFITAIAELFSSADILSTLNGLLGLACAGALAFLAYCRWKGMHPSALFHIIICIYLMLRLVCQYRLWSADPQIQDYFFSLLATVCSMLASYYCAAFSANTGNRQLHTLFHLAGVYFCLVSVPHCDNPLFYLTMAAWLFTDLCNLTPMPRDKR